MVIPSALELSQIRAAFLDLNKQLGEVRKSAPTQAVPSNQGVRIIQVQGGGQGGQPPTLGPHRSTHLPGGSDPVFPAPANGYLTWGSFGMGWESILWDDIEQKPSLFPPALHGTAHAPGGIDTVFPAPAGGVLTHNGTEMWWSPFTWDALEGKPTSFPAAAHATSHLPGSTDTVFPSPASGALFHNGTEMWWGAFDWANLEGKPSSFTPSAHATGHLPGAADTVFPSPVSGALFHNGTSMAWEEIQIADVAGLQAALNAAGGSPSWGAITGKPAGLITNNPNGTSRLYRADDPSGYYLRHTWTGTHWWLRGYAGDDSNFHADVRVGRADSAGNADALEIRADGSAPINLNTVGIGRVFNYNSIGNWVNGPAGMSYGSVYNFSGSDNDSVLSLQVAADVNHNSTSSTKDLWFRTGNNLGFQNDWMRVIHSGNIGSQSVNFANSAGNADTLDGSHANAFAPAGHGHTRLGGLYPVPNGSPDQDALEIREADLVGSAQYAIGYAPAIGFHWGNRYFGHLLMEANGVLGWWNSGRTAELPFRAGALSLSGNATFGHFGVGLVGTYASTRYQQVFAMGEPYTMAADGTALNNFYGIAWTHSNVGGQSISGLDHQALFCMGGVTQTAIGKGVWTRGSISAWGNITAYASDRRLKENIEVIPDALEKVKALHGVTYQWNTEGRNYLRDDGRRHAGVLAQEVQAVLPEAVCPAPFDVDGATGQSRTGQNYLTVQNERLVALLIEAAKELSAKVDRLEAEVKR